MKKTVFFMLSLCLLLSGCASFGRGVAEAIMKPAEKNLGECMVFTEGFDGIRDIMEKNNGRVKILMIHGIGKKSPGHSSSIAAALAYRLGLNTEIKNHKDIILQSNNEPNADIGHLRAYKYYNETNSQELIFYEYTWSSIAERIKNDLSYDNYDLNAEKRTDINKKIKTFINDTVIEPFIYLGNEQARNDILTGVSQALCWAVGKNWEDMPSDGTYSCQSGNISNVEMLSEYVILTHSLGSQISIDTLENLATKTAEYRADKTKKINVTIYMFANQLPAIAIASNKPNITGQIDKYCKENAPLFSERLMDTTKIIAFSDPNDILSYSIPSKFENKYIDSRICPEISNILVNVAPLSSIFGSMNANPLEAHLNYKNDERVINLIIEGISSDTPQASPHEGCYITTTK